MSSGSTRTLGVTSACLNEGRLPLSPCSKVQLGSHIVTKMARDTKTELGGPHEDGRSVGACNGGYYDLRGAGSRSSARRAGGGRAREYRRREVHGLCLGRQGDQAQTP